MFSARFETKYIEPLIVNIEAYFKAGEADAFVWANGGQPMDATEVWRKSRWFNTLFPVTSIFPVATNPVESEDSSRIESQNRITIEVEIDGNDPDLLASQVMRRINAYDALLRKMTIGDLFKGYNNQRRDFQGLEIGPHSYSSFVSVANPTIYKQVGSFGLVISVIEVSS